MPKKINAFEIAVAEPKIKNYKRRMAAPGDYSIATAIDEFVVFKEDEKTAKIKKENAFLKFKPFAVETYVSAAFDGVQENPILNGHNKQCMFIIQNKTSNIKDTNKHAIAGLGINPVDVIDEINEFSFDSEIMSYLDKDDAKHIGEFLGKYLKKYPGLLKVKKRSVAKKDILYKLPRMTDHNPEQMKQLIELLQYINYAR